jgi:glycosyltransferase involved in cell wall biosynthesis
VRRDKQIALADALRAHRERLDEIVTELAERGEPISRLEARLIADAGSVRLEDIEAALRHDGASPATRGKLVQRLRSWAKPRIGVLRHYEPKRLTVPKRYLDATPPAQPPTISLVTPSYQQGRFLDKTLYSVVSQKYPALEYVVQDGASTDGTLAVLGRFGPLLTSWASEPDSGQADAINRGFAHTTGELMAWLNSDDLLLPGTLAYVARYFAEHPDVDVVYGHRLMIDDTDGQVGAWVLPAHSDLALTLADYVPQETLFWRRRIWDAAGGYVDASFGYALDWDLLLRFREAGAKMVRLPRFLGAFRIHAEQKTTAIDAVGVAETERLRLRVHGRPVPIEEVLRRLRPYFLRHISAHTRQRLADRLPHARVAVTVEPAEPWLRTPVGERLGAASLRPVEPRVTISPLAPAAPGTPLPDGSVADEHGHAVPDPHR